MEYPKHMLFAGRAAVLSAPPLPKNYSWIYTMGNRMVRLSHGAYRLLSAWNRRWISRQVLAELDAVRLDDLGLTKAQALTEARTPFWRAGGCQRYVRKSLFLPPAIQRAADRLRLIRSYHRYYSELLSLDDGLISDINVHKGDFRILARQAAIADQIGHARRRRRRRLSF